MSQTRQSPQNRQNTSRILSQNENEQLNLNTSQSCPTTPVTTPNSRSGVSSFLDEIMAEDDENVFHPPLPFGFKFPIEKIGKSLELILRSSDKNSIDHSQMRELIKLVALKMQKHSMM